MMLSRDMREDMNLGGLTPDCGSPCSNRDIFTLCHSLHANYRSAISKLFSETGTISDWLSFSSVIYVALSLTTCAYLETLSRSLRYRGWMICFLCPVIRKLTERTLGQSRRADSGEGRSSYVSKCQSYTKAANKKLTSIYNI